MAKGYLAGFDLDTVTGLSLPLIFRFQFNPDILSEKKSWKYKEAPFGKFDFDQTAAASGLVATLTGFSSDLKEIGSLLSGTQPLQAEGGDQRVFAIDFSLDGSVGEDPTNPTDTPRYGAGNIEPDLATLRSFVNPVWGLIDLTKMIFSGFKNIPAKVKPPECTLIYGNLNVVCVMTDLNIKVIAFNDDGSALRADISVTLKEQTLAYTPIVEFVKRQVNVAKSYGRPGIGDDFLKTAPIVSMFT